MLIDGKDSDQIAADDRGLLYGDGLFETFAVRNGVPQLWSQHLDRLQRDCARLGIVPPPVELLHTEALQLCAGHARAVLKIVITRGSGGRGYRLPEQAMPRRILSLHPWPGYPEQYATQGVRARLCTLRLGSNPRLAGIKHLNRLEQVLARAEWNDPGIAEGLLLDGAGHLVEGTMSNVFLVRDGCLLTPVLDECGVAGVMRAQILEQAARLGIPGVVAPLRLDDVATAEEMFFCNSLIGLWPVRQFEQQEFAVGPLTRCLQQAIESPDHA
jgi:4-amino-4-deoxychorismate lyase